MALKFFEERIRILVILQTNHIQTNKGNHAK